MKATLVALAASCAVLVAAPAAAQDMRVEYSDLNLSTKEGQKALERRIDAAARKFCAYDEIVTGSRVKNSSSVQCYREARAEAKKQFAALIADKQLGG